MWQSVLDLEEMVEITTCRCRQVVVVDRPVVMDGGDVGPDPQEVPQGGLGQLVDNSVSPQQQHGHSQEVTDWMNMSNRAKLK